MVKSCDSLDSVFDDNSNHFLILKTSKNNKNDRNIISQHNYKTYMNNAGRYRKKYYSLSEKVFATRRGITEKIRSHSSEEYEELLARRRFLKYKTKESQLKKEFSATDTLAEVLNKLKTDQENNLSITEANLNFPLHFGLQNENDEVSNFVNTQSEIYKDIKLNNDLDFEFTEAVAVIERIGTNSYDWRQSVHLYTESEKINFINQSAYEMDELNSKVSKKNSQKKSTLADKQISNDNASKMSKRMRFPRSFSRKKKNIATPVNQNQVMKAKIKKRSKISILFWIFQRKSQRGVKTLSYIKSSEETVQNVEIAKETSEVNRSPETTDVSCFQPALQPEIEQDNLPGANTEGHIELGENTDNQINPDNPDNPNQKADEDHIKLLPTNKEDEVTIDHKKISLVDKPEQHQTNLPIANVEENVTETDFEHKENINIKVSADIVNETINDGEDSVDESNHDTIENNREEDAESTCKETKQIEVSEDNEHTPVNLKPTDSSVEPYNIIDVQATIEIHVDDENIEHKDIQADAINTTRTEVECMTLELDEVKGVVEEDENHCSNSIPADKTESQEFLTNTSEIENSSAETGINIETNKQILKIQEDELNIVEDNANLFEDEINKTEVTSPTLSRSSNKKVSLFKRMFTSKRKRSNSKTSQISNIESENTSLDVTTVSINETVNYGEDRADESNRDTIGNNREEDAESTCKETKQIEVSEDNEHTPVNLKPTDSSVEADNTIDVQATIEIPVDDENIEHKDIQADAINTTHTEEECMKLELDEVKGVVEEDENHCSNSIPADKTESQEFLTNTSEIENSSAETGINIETNKQIPKIQEDELSIVEDNANLFEDEINKTEVTSTTLSRSSNKKVSLFKRMFTSKRKRSNSKTSQTSSIESENASLDVQIDNDDTVNIQSDGLTAKHNDLVELNVRIEKTLSTNVAITDLMVKESNDYSRYSQISFKMPFNDDNMDLSSLLNFAGELTYENSYKPENKL